MYVLFNWVIVVTEILVYYVFVIMEKVKVDKVIKLI